MLSKWQLEDIEKRYRRSYCYWIYSRARLISEIKFLLKKVQSVEVSDTTKFNSSTAGDNKKIFLQLLCLKTENKELFTHKSYSLPHTLQVLLYFSLLFFQAVLYGCLPPYAG